jgi:hypothetical protein
MPGLSQLDPTSRLAADGLQHLCKPEIETLSIHVVAKPTHSTRCAKSERSNCYL